MRASGGTRSERVRAAPCGLRPDGSARRRPRVRRGRAGHRDPPRRRGRRDRRQPRQPRPLLLRQHGDGPPPDRGGASPRRGQVRAGRDRVRLSEAHAGPVLRGAPVGRIPRGHERALRRGQEGAPGHAAGLPRPVRPQRDLPAPGEPLRAGRQLRPALQPRDPRAHPALRGGAPRRRGVDHLLGHRSRVAGVPLRRGLRRGDRCARPSATTARSRSTSARARRSRSASSPSGSRRSPDSPASCFGTRASPTASRAAGSTRRAPGTGSTSRRSTPLDDGLRRTIDWFRAQTRDPGARTAALR